MAEWKKICCAIDFSEASRVSMETAADLALRLRGELTLLHVNEAALTTFEDDGLSPREVADRAARDIHPKMASWHRWAEQAMGRSVAVKVLVGRAADEILRFVGEGSFDLLVMGTHGRLGLAHFVIGSVTEEVQRHAPCPVLVIRGS